MKRALAAAALLVVGVVPAMASAAPERGVVVLSGPGGSTVELTVTQDVELDDTLGTLTGGDDYAGVLVEPVQRTASGFGLLQVRAFRDGTQTAVAPFGGPPQLRAGRYRVTLLGDGPVTARFPMADRSAPAVRVRATQRLPVQFLGRAETLAEGRSRAAIVFPNSLPRGKRALLATLMRGVRVEDLRTCAATTSTCPDSVRRQVGTDDSPALLPVAVTSSSAVRNLVFSVDGYREAPDDLRAVAIVF